MKNFEYQWDDSIFLLHLQLSRSNPENSLVEAIVSRKYKNEKTDSELVSINSGDKSHRFIISRTHPKEIALQVEYPNTVVLEVFKIDDRTYYPTNSFFVW